MLLLLQLLQLLSPSPRATHARTHARMRTWPAPTNQPPIPPVTARPQFVYVIRKRISIPSDKAIFIFVNNTLPPTSALMSSVYESHKDEDGFMYMMYSGENTFGGERDESGDESGDGARA